MVFSLRTDELSFYNQKMQEVSEFGEFKLWVALNAAERLEGEFEVVE